MRAVIAAQSWLRGESGVLHPTEVADAVRSSWEAAAPHVEVLAVPLPDGGPRTADVLHGPAVHVGGAVAKRVGEAVVLAPVDGLRWEPAGLFSALMGLAAAGERGPVWVPVGDVAPAGDATDLWGGGVAAARSVLATLDVVVLVGAQRPLLGFTGMSAAVRDGREYDDALAVAAQAQEERWATIAREVDPVATRRTLMGPVRLSDQPGTGAAGGLAYGLAALGARLQPAAPAVARMVGLDAAAADASVVVPVVDRLDAHALDHGATSAASMLAAERGAPCVAVTSHLAVGKRDLMAGGVAGAHEGAPGMDGLADQIRRVAHTWTPLR